MAVPLPFNVVTVFVAPADREPGTDCGVAVTTGFAAVIFWLMRNWVGLRTAVITAPFGIPVPETDSPTQSEAVLTAVRTFDPTVPVVSILDV